MSVSTTAWSPPSVPSSRSRPCTRSTSFPRDLPHATIRSRSSIGSRCRSKTRSRDMCPCRSGLPRALGLRRPRRRRTNRRPRSCGERDDLPAVYDGPGARGSPRCGPPHLRAAPSGRSHHRHLGLRGFAVADHRRVGFDRGRAGSSRASGRGCSGACHPTSVRRAWPGAHRSRSVLARGTADRALARSLRAAPVHRGPPGPDARSPRGRDGSAVTCAAGWGASTRSVTSVISFARSVPFGRAHRPRVPTIPPARVGVVLENLRDPDGPTLFEHDPRERRLQWMIDRVRERYGARALLWGPCGDPRGPYTGVKIAYQSFPDMARLRWFGILGPDALKADNGRAPGLPRASSTSIARVRTSA